MKRILWLALAIIRGNSGTDRLLYLFKGVLWAVRKRMGQRFVARLWNGARVSVQPVSSYSGIFYYRYIEGQDFLFFRANSELSDTLIDVGANVGLFSAMLLDRFKNIVLFEPSPSTFAALVETVRLNRKEGLQIVSHNMACSDSKGAVQFIEEDDLSSTSRILSGPVGNSKTVTVSADCLENVLGDKYPDLVMKVDVEGHEEAVFRGAAGLFARKTVKLVMFERLGRTNLDNILVFMVSYGYKVFRVMDDGMISTEPRSVHVPLINLFACPEELLSRIQGNRELRKGHKDGTR